MISTRGRYAVRIMIEIGSLCDAENPEQSVPVSLETISKNQNLSKKYSENIVGKMTKAGLLKSAVGRTGGYRLVKKPCDYRIDEILESTEGSLAPVSCLLPGAPTCENAKECKSLSLWQQYDILTKDFFHKVTLEDLINGTISA